MMDLFADRIGNVTITGGLVRIEFLRMKPPSQTNHQVAFDVSGQMVMPIDGFLRSIEVMTRLRQRLIDEGVLKASPASAPVAEQPST